MLFTLQQTHTAVYVSLIINNMNKSANFDINATRKMELSLLEGGVDGEYNGICLVKISKKNRPCSLHFSLEQNHLMENISYDN